MNIFVLSKFPELCALYHCDKHVVKMILESAQMISTAIRLTTDVSPYQDEVLYKKSFQNHPSAIWVRESFGNYTWHLRLWNSLCREYTYRYGKVHKSYSRLNLLFNSNKPNFDKVGITPMPQCMPEEYKNPSTVKAYRDYYIGEKYSFAKWTRRTEPEWFNFN